MFGWGTSDFLANNASEKIGHAKTFFWSQIAGLGLITLLLFLEAPRIVVDPFLLALTIGGAVAYALGYLFFYRGFEIGNVSVISAVVNLQVLFVIIISFLRGQRLSMVQIPAVFLLLIGVILTSVNFNDLKKGSISLLAGVKETLLATVMFGVFYWPVNEYIVEQAHWLVIGFITKFTAVIIVFLIGLFQKQSMLIQKSTKKLIMLISAVGLLEAVGALSVSYGQSYGDGIIVVPISSALTVVTVSLAMVFTKERISRIQGVGITLVIVGIIMTAF